MSYDFRIVALLLTGSVFISCTSAGGPQNFFPSYGTLSIGKCGGYITLNMTATPILTSDIDAAKKHCAGSRTTPCLDLITKRGDNDFIYHCKEME
jgi:hypothetical protein